MAWQILLRRLRCFGRDEWGIRVLFEKFVTIAGSEAVSNGPRQLRVNRSFCTL